MIVCLVRVCDAAVTLISVAVKDHLTAIKSRLTRVSRQSTTTTTTSSSSSSSDCCYCCCLCSPDIGRSQGSLDSDEKPLESSESDSLGEYEDPEVSKFNEDGSFIGLYGQKNRPPPPATQPSPPAYTTFV